MSSTIRLGNTEQNKFLNHLLKEKLGAYSLSEPQSGSDARNTETFAKKTEINTDNGTKIVTNGHSSDLVIFFV